jgi:AmiR/NasT family two-component response regulator
MASRAVIEQAKGVIMATTRCSADEAFRVLAEQSQHENRKLREVAEEIVGRQV